jgi:FixJ family two-component response regulator
MSDTTVFVVSDDPAIRDSLSELIVSADLNAEAFSSLEVWLEAVGPGRQGCLVLDARAHDFTGSERLAVLTATCARLPVLFLVDRGDVSVAVRAIKEGAADVLEKPLRDGSLLERINMAARVVRDVDCNQ